MAVINGVKQGVSASLVLNDYAIIRDEKAAGTDAGTFTAGAWQTRVLNTVQANRGSSITLASNQITLLDGFKYWVTASATAYQVDNHKVRFRNTSDATTDIAGGTAFAGDTENQANEAILVGVVDLTAAGADKVFELQHYGQTTQATNGFGFGWDQGQVEVFATVEVWKIT